MRSLFFKNFLIPLAIVPTNNYFRQDLLATNNPVFTLPFLSSLMNKPYN